MPKKNKEVPAPADVKAEAKEKVIRLPPGKSAGGTKEEKLAASAKRVKKERKATISGTCRDLIRSGKTNEEVWAIVQPMFKMPDHHKHYPGWYRAQMVRAGELSKAKAKKTAHSPEPAPAKA